MQDRVRTEHPLVVARVRSVTELGQLAVFGVGDILELAKVNGKIRYSNVENIVGANNKSYTILSWSYLSDMAHDVENSAQGALDRQRNFYKYSPDTVAPVTTWGLVFE